jgi:polyhydroxyalkanoate synthesis regulator phasin
MTRPWYEREEELLERDLEEGRITQQEFNAFMRDMRREMEDCAREAAQDAYEREMGW